LNAIKEKPPEHQSCHGPDCFLWKDPSLHNRMIVERLEFNMVDEHAI